MLIMSHKLINIYLYWCLRKLCNYCRLEYGITFGWKKLSGWSLLMRGCLHRRMRMCTFCTVYSLYCVHVLCRPQGGGHTCGLSRQLPAWDGSNVGYSSGCSHSYHKVGLQTVVQGYPTSMWHATLDTLHVTCDTWHMTCGGGWTLFKNIIYEYSWCSYFHCMNTQTLFR